MLKPYALLAVASAFLPTARARGPDIPPPPKFQMVVKNVAYANGIVNAGDGSGRLFVVTQEGEILVTRGRGKHVFLDISALTDMHHEWGLLGLVFAPDYATSGLFYIQYTAVGDGRTVLAEYQVSATDPDQADASSARILLEYDDEYPTHNGGDLHFGPDGYLYLGLGDGGALDDPLESGEDLTTLWGKMLRIDPDPTAGESPDCDSAGDYSIPADNPFVDGAGGACDEIWAYGLRNPWRFSFDGGGNLYIADVGQFEQEEVDFQRAGVGGQNYGWDIVEGTICHEPDVDCDTTGFRPPVLTYDHVDGRCAITGGYVYRGSVLPALRGSYVYGDYCSGEIWAGQRLTGDWETKILQDTRFAISTFGETDSGELCFADYGEHGAVYCWLP